MKKISSKIYIRIGIIALVIVAGLFLFTHREKNVEVPENAPVPITLQTRPPKSEPAVPKPTQKNTSVEIVPTEKILLTAGDTAVTIPFSSGATLYEILTAAEKSGTIIFSGKDYPGLGFFVTDIGTLHQSEGKFLVYFINDKEASVGISSYVPKNGDRINWKLE